MTKKEKIDIGIILTTAMEIILNKYADTEDVANSAIDMCRDMLKTYPELREFVDDMISNYDKDDDKFNENWDKQIAWIRWEKEMLK